MKRFITALAAFSLAAITTAQAQFTSPAALSPDALLGDPTSGTETGIFEYLPTVQTAALVLVGLVLAMKGIQWVRKIVRSA